MYVKQKEIKTTHDGAEDCVCGLHKYNPYIGLTIGAPL